MNMQRSTPEKQGVRSRAVMDFLNKIEAETQELHSFMLLKNGKVISECWWEPYAPQYRHQLFSLSKSFTSTAIGLAANEGLLTVDTLVTDIFKKEVEELGNGIDQKMKKMTVKNLLTMATGMEYENWGFGDNETNNIKNFLSSHIKNEPGSVFFYHTLATYMQSAIITRLTGQKLADYLAPRLFGPLGIEPRWEEDNFNINYGGFGLNIKTEDIAKLGQLYLQKGLWNGRRLIPEAWIEEATAKQIENAAPGDAGNWSFGYGYQFWRCKPEGVYRGDGAMGQFCIVMPGENAVVAITSNSDMSKVMDLVWEILWPALKESNEPSGDRAEYDKLKQMQKNLSHLKNKINFAAPPFPKINGEYKNENIGAFLDVGETEGVLHLKYKNLSSAYRFKKGEWADNASEYIFGGEQQSKLFLRCKIHGEWKPQKNALDLTVWHYETPNKFHISLQFNKNKTKLTIGIEEFNRIEETAKTN